MRAAAGLGILVVWLATGCAAYVVLADEVFSDEDERAAARSRPRALTPAHLRAKARLSFEERMELGREIGLRWQRNEIPVHEIRVEDPDPAEVRRMLAQIDRVPEAYQRFLNEAGGKVVIYEGVLTDQPEWVPLRGVNVNLWKGYPHTWDDIDFAYKPGLDRAYLKHGCDGSRRYRDGAVIHEMGHMLDDLLGDVREDSGRLSQSPLFQAIHRETLATSDTGWVGKIESPRRSRSELFAEGFEAFYYCRESRLQQAREQRRLHRYYTDLEEEFIEAAYVTLEREVTAEFERRRRETILRATRWPDDRVAAAGGW